MLWIFFKGLLRFATSKFSLEPEDLANTFIHLTNFAMTKKGEFEADYPPGTQVLSIMPSSAVSFYL